MDEAARREDPTDARVAAAMGLTWDERRCRICGWALGEKDGLRWGCTPESCAQRPAPAHRADTPAPYTTDIAAAWQVVTYLHKQDVWMERLEQIGHEMWRCCLEVRPRDGRAWVQGVGATAPEAICCAALLVIERHL
jgi:hypothetical protein